MCVYCTCCLSARFAQCACLCLRRLFMSHRRLWPGAQQPAGWRRGCMFYFSRSNMPWRHHYPETCSTQRPLLFDDGGVVPCLNLITVTEIQRASLDMAAHWAVWGCVKPPWWWEDVIFFVMHTPALPEREEVSMRGTWLIEGTEAQSPANAKEASACTLWSAWAHCGWSPQETCFCFYSCSQHITSAYY